MDLNDNNAKNEAFTQKVVKEITGVLGDVMERKAHVHVSCSNLKFCFVEFFFFGKERGSKRYRRNA